MSDGRAGTVNAQRFLFGEDLARPARQRRETAEQAEAETRALREAAERDGYARGLAEGRRLALAEAEARRADAMERVACALPSLVAILDEAAERIEAEALAFFEALARRVAGEALLGQPLAPIREAARETFRHLRGVPHVVARVHESLVEDADSLLRGLAREQGYEGRIVVLGSDDVAPGDVRLDWADGGVASDRKALADAVAATLAAAGAAPRDPDPAGPEAFTK